MSVAQSSLKIIRDDTTREQHTPQVAVVTDQDGQRAAFYRLVAHFLSEPPTTAHLSLARELTGEPGTPIGGAVNALAVAARDTTVKQEAEAFQTLFIGLGRGILVPFGSYYLTGFLNEKPLARLREDMHRLGMARSDDVSEPEDHISSVMEIMAGLIDGRINGPCDPTEQRQFFEAHVGSWAGQFFRDLAADDTSALYAALGALGERFIAIEASAFKLD